MEPRSSGELVDLASADSRLIIDLRYATAANFTGAALYPVARALLVPAAARRLSAAQDWLETNAGADVVSPALGRPVHVVRGARIKVWDAYRPFSVQCAMWKKLPDERFIAPPTRGSRHNRGTTVDVTLCDAVGRELEMPTDLDEFSERAHRDFGGCSPAAAAHRDLLHAAMTAGGFVGINSEWWHYDAADWEAYPVLDVPLE